MKLGMDLLVYSKSESSSASLICQLTKPASFWEIFSTSFQIATSCHSDSILWMLLFQVDATISDF